MVQYQALLDDWQEKWIKNVACKHHPCGSIFYNPGGYEPDERCINCGDYL